MSDFINFVYWFACVFASALCVAGFAWDHWYFESAAMSLFLPLCISLMFGSFLFLGLWRFRLGRCSYPSLLQTDAVERISQTNNIARRNANLRRPRRVLD